MKYPWIIQPDMRMSTKFHQGLKESALQSKVGMSMDVDGRWVVGFDQHGSAMIEWNIARFPMGYTLW